MAPAYLGAVSAFAAVSVSLSGCGDSPAPSTPAPVVPVPVTDCMCLFDIDRTLTGEQSSAEACPNDVLMPNIWDSAYAGGALLMSEGMQGLHLTYCKNCYIGIISAGDANGTNSAMRSILRAQLDIGVGDLPFEWGTEGCNSTGTPLIPKCQDGHKQYAIPAIKKYYEDRSGGTIMDDKITLFDDRESNILPFEHQTTTRYNARQISCASRAANPDDPDSTDTSVLGKCGATVAEINFGEKDTGTHTCIPRTTSPTTTTLSTTANSMPGPSVEIV